MPEKKKEGPWGFSEAIENEMLGIFNHHPNKTFNYKQMSKYLSDFDAEKTDVLACMFKLRDKGRLIEVEKGKFKIKPTTIYAEGIIDVSASGAAYVMNEDFEEDIYIASKNVKHALHGDKVKIYLYAKRKDKRLEGEVIEVLERSKTEFVGVVQVSSKFAFLIPDSVKMQVDIFIPLNSLNGAKDGQKAIAEITDWPKGTKNPFGKITNVLGWPGENDAEMNAILLQYGFPTEFPAAVEREAEAIPTEITAEEVKKRKDFRPITTFTIDPVDAKDFDDALSLRQLENGNWEVGVHIADVTHYVEDGTILDNEAFERATSIYLVDRVIPMLPEKLSNNVCSLRPKEDKLCFSAVFEFDNNAKLKNEWFGKTVIHSNHRFSYEDAQSVLDAEEGPFFNELKVLDSLAKNLREERFKKGAINFEKTEVKFKLDEKGNPLGVFVKESKDTNKLIEEFMLMANKRVAEFVGKIKHGEQKKTFVYRIHDAPVAERLNDFSVFVSKFGYKINAQNNKDVAQSLNNLIKDIRGKKEQNVIEQLAIRTMSKAIYSTDNIGHYGLAFDYYSHFTSPIRRYPDVLVHRLLTHYLKGGKSVPVEEVDEKCKHSTEMEIKAADAERTSIKYKQVQFLQNKIGETFEGLISGVTEWGIYIELIENKCEGMIRLRDIADDFYEFDESNYAIKGARTGKTYQLGDTVKVVLKKTDLLKKQIDFLLVQDLGSHILEHGHQEKRHYSEGRHEKSHQKKKESRGRKDNGPKGKSSSKGKKKRF